MKAKARKGADSTQLPLPLEFSITNSTERFSVEAKLFPNREGRTVTLSELAAATGISMARLRSWTKKGVVPGALHPAPGCHWQFERLEIERWWRDLRRGRDLRAG
jgi:hypothetical protein